MENIKIKDYDNDIIRFWWSTWTVWEIIKRSYFSIKELKTLREEKTAGLEIIRIEVYL